MTDAPKIPFELENKILSLQESIQNRLPGMSTMLQEIWNALKKHPENVTLLSEAEIQIIVSGLEIQTNNKLTEVLTKKSPGTKKLKTLTADDL